MILYSAPTNLTQIKLMAQIGKQVPSSFYYYMLFMSDMEFQKLMLDLVEKPDAELILIDYMIYSNERRRNNKNYDINKYILKEKLEQYRRGNNIRGNERIRE